MKENDDIWLKQWKDCLEDFEEEVPVGGWEKLQADLQAHDPLVQQETPSDEPLVIEMTPAHDEEDKAKPAARVIPFQRWRIVAAAAVVVLIAGAGIWFLASDKVPQVPTIESPIAQVSQTEIPDPMQPMSAAETATEESTTTDDEMPAPVKQEEAHATHARMLTKEDGQIDWRMDAAVIERRIRGLNPWPAAYSVLDGKLCKLYAATVVQGAGVPGEVLAVEKNGFTVACGENALFITQLQMEGKKRMAAEDFLRGYELQTGRKLG